MDKAVVAVHLESDWAVVIAANRKPTGRRTITPFVLFTQHSPLFAVCPNLQGWAAAGLVRALHTGLLNEHQREQVLSNAVQDLIREIAMRADVRQIAHTGTVRNLLAFPFQQALESFAMGEEPAFRWLCTNSYGDTAKHAMQALRLARYLADKHGLDKPTQREREEKGMKNLLGGYRAKPVF